MIKITLMNQQTKCMVYDDHLQQKWCIKLTVKTADQEITKIRRTQHNGMK